MVKSTETQVFWRGSCQSMEIERERQSKPEGPEFDSSELHVALILKNPVPKEKEVVLTNIPGYNFSLLLRETIQEVIDALSSDRKQAEAILRKQMKKIEEYDIKQINFHECLGYFLLSKLYFIEQKCRDLKINVTKITKHKNYLFDKIKNGLRSYDHLQEKYKIFAGKGKSEEMEKEQKQKQKQKQKKKEHGRL